jgi:ABC-type polysaccharide/polyol phosphate export permease
VTALVVILTTLNVLFRDLKFVSSFILSLLFYLTPIFYPARYIPINFQFILDYNVFYYLLKPFQILSSSFLVVDFFQSLLGALSVSIILIIIAIYVWRKNRKYLVIYA